MAGAAGGELASAITRGGGLGFVGAGYWDSAKLATEWTIVRKRLGSAPPRKRLPAGIGLLAWNLTKKHGSYDPSASATSPTIGLIDEALRAHPSAIMIAFGSPQEMTAWCHYIRERDHQVSGCDSPVTLLVMVNSVDEARAAVQDMGADVLVVQGHEAGGHGDAKAPPRDVLLSTILDNMASWGAKSPPVVSAGGISDGRAIASQLVLGADGVLVGTRFLLTPEATYSDAQKEKLLRAQGTDTVRSFAFDDARGTLDWPDNIDGRGLKSTTVDEYDAAAQGHQRPVPGQPERHARYVQALQDGDTERQIIWSGTGIGQVCTIQPAAEAVQQLHSATVHALKRAALRPAPMTVTASGSREHARPDDSGIELGNLRGASEPGVESDSAHAQLLNSDGARSSSRDLVQSASDAAGRSGAVAAVISYCVASISMTVINKFAVSGDKFTMNLLVLLCQCTVSVLIVLVAKHLGWIQIRELNMRDVKTWFPISTMLVIVIYTGSKALQHMDIPIYTIFKNLTIILIQAYGELIWFDGRITSMVFLSFVLMVASSVIAAWPDLATSVAPTLHRRALNAVGMYTGVPAPSAASSATAQASASVAQWPSLGTSGYFWMLLNCLVSATYVLVMRKRIKLTGFKDWDTMFFNNLLSIPVLLIMSLLVENWSKETFERNFPAERRTSLIIAVLLSGTGGVFISYTTAWCIRVTSSTTYSMVGALNKLPLALSGILFFGNPVTIYNSLGIAVGFVAGLVYAVGKNKQAEAARLANSAATGVAATRSGGGHISNPKGEIPTHNRERQD
ncbi:GDP-mannose transporter into the lumen of the Golgi [Malassezia caprae]|uniref:GDP-mannose transporter into the lumen of the Golgi n=1 Tax=Malassezia caprae TaxID=1381934 RepID=A0AAF0IZM8_9BASI|nr:GDP-mannose transporter into the lumen of the Golgi [Malassezia caprae]